MRKNVRIYGVALICCLIAVGCGPDAKQKALRGTLIGLNAARDGFVAWDDHHQQGIVDSATSLEDGKAKLAAYRASREKLVLGFEIAYKALAVAALEPNAANVGEALRAAGDLYNLVRAMMGADTPAAVLTAPRPKSETKPAEPAPTVPAPTVPAPATPAEPPVPTPGNPG